MVMVMLMLMKKIKLKMKQKKKGQAMVEFALLMPILILLIMGLLEFGLILNTYLAMNNAAREGARAGISGATDVQIQTAVLNTSPSLNPAYLTLTITPTQLTRKSGDTLKVTVNYNYHTIIPLIGSILHNVIGLNAQTSMRVE